MKIEIDKCTFLNGAMGWRLGVITAERVLGGDVTMDDIQGYGPVLLIEWSRIVDGEVHCCVTDCMGKLVRKYSYKYPWL